MNWSLDEFAMPDIFPMSEESESPATMETLHADMHATLAEERGRIEADAYARGRAEGERVARERATGELASAVSALESAVTDVQLHAARWTSNAEENIAALAVAVARHIVQHEVTVAPDTVRALVMRALVQLPVDAPIIVRLHPDDIDACSALVMQDKAGRTPDIRWTADAHVLRGGCLIEGRERIIDGRIDTALERAYRSIGNIQA
ncbi:MAG: FliH/SctL family protein [Gemmatimonadota bacterium]